MIRESLAILHEHNLEYEKSLEHYFELKSSKVFSIIKKRKMFEFVKENWMKLFHQDKDKTLEMLMEYINDIPVDFIGSIWIFVFNYHSSRKPLSKFCHLLQYGYSM